MSVVEEIRNLDHLRLKTSERQPKIQIFLGTKNCEIALTIKKCLEVNCDVKFEFSMQNKSSLSMGGSTENLGARK